MWVSVCSPLWQARANVVHVHLTGVGRGGEGGEAEGEGGKGVMHALTCTNMSRGRYFCLANHFLT